MNETQTLSETEAAWATNFGPDLLNQFVDDGHIERTGTGNNRRYSVDSICKMFDILSVENGGPELSTTHDISIVITPKKAIVKGGAK